VIACFAVLKSYRAIFVLLSAVLTCTSVCFGQNASSQNLDREFQAAVARYESGKYAEAATQLEALLREVPESFEVHELLGLVYSAQSEDTKASAHLEKAVRLKPESGAAHTNLATNLVRLGKLEPAEREFKRARDLEPRNYEVNHNLGEFYIRAGKVPVAIPFLEQAQQIGPSSYDNGYDLSLAYIVTGRLADARQLIGDLLKRKDSAELHNLLAQVEEKDGNFVAAANEYEAAAHMDPSESNLFDWGGELLLHRTLDPAVTVFQKAAETYPKSQRVKIGLGIALYSRGNYDDAVKSLLEAADLNPSDPGCYLFLAKAYDSSPGQADEVISRFRRFAELQPANARAQYYYAMSLWKGKRTQDPALDGAQIESLLRKAISLDPALAEAHLQLGNIYADETKYAESIPAYLRAIELNPDLADAHYRLGQAYVRIGERDRAQEQIQIYQRLRQQHLAELDKQRADIRQFVYSAKERPASEAP
jgi:tetratricopeptide (TPR) repeat protein